MRDFYSMGSEEHEKDELLVRYLDHELSSTEIERFEELLRFDPALRQKLSDWQVLGEKLGELRALNPTGRRLGASFADRVLQGAQSRVRDQGDPSFAPWIARETASTTVDSASRLQTRDGDLDSILKEAHLFRPTRRWIVQGTLLVVAASLLAMMVLRSPLPKPQSLISPGQSIAQPSPLSGEASTNQIVIHDEKNASTKAVVSSEAADQSLASAASSVTQDSKARVVPGPTDEKSKITLPSSNSLAEASPVPTGSKEAASMSIGPDLKPSAEQIKMLEAMIANPNGMFHLVIDIQLPENITDLDALRGILDRHDIAWASELDIDASIQSNLAKSRMIAEAGQQGLIPDFVDPALDRSKSKESGDDQEVVSLVFVKARGSRLDAAIIDVMRQTEEFPMFSFDLALDPPTHALMEELRFIQEASLPGASLRVQENVSNVIQRSRGTNFLAGPRRTKAMDMETRRQGRLPLDAETMNPISYALFIVRHASPSSNR